MILHFGLFSGALTSAGHAVSINQKSGKPNTTKSMVSSEKIPQNFY